MAAHLIPAAEAAEQLGIPLETLRKIVQRKGIACRRPSGRPKGRVYFSEQDLADYVASIASPAAARQSA